MIRRYNTSVSALLNSKKPSLLRTIREQHETATETQQKLLNFKIPYFNHTKVCFFNGTKLVLKTEIPELIAKFRELKKELIALLNTSEYFSNLRTLELILVFEPKIKTTENTQHFPEQAQIAFKSLANTLEDDPIKEAIHNLLQKHNES